MIEHFFCCVYIQVCFVGVRKSRDLLEMVKYAFYKLGNGFDGLIFIVNSTKICHNQGLKLGY